MKQLFFTLIAVVIATVTLAQAPDLINYQAVARDGSGDILSNQSINVTFLIRSGSSGGTVVFEEDHTGINTNDFGLFSLQIGNGTNVSGSINGINWSGSNHWLEVEVNGASVGAQQLVSVPYALTSQMATDMQLNDLTDVSGSPSGGQVLGWTGSAWMPQNDATGTTYVAGTGIGISGNTISADLGTSISTGEIVNGAVTANKLDQMGASSGEILKWNGTAWAPASDDIGASPWSTSGSNIYYNTGNVGIGTSFPSASLQIDAAASGQDPLRVRVGLTTKLMVHENGGVGLGYSITQPPADGMIVAGDVGIGTSSPSTARVHIHEPTSGASNIRFTNNTTGTSSSDGCYTGYNSVETMFIWNYENTGIRIGTNNSTVIEIENSGLVGIKELSPTAMLHIKQEGTGEEALALENDTDSDTWAWEIGANDLNFYFNGSTVGYWNDATGAYTATSDRSLKKDIEYIDDPKLPAVMQLRPAMYRLIYAEEASQKAVGFIAQEVQEHLPEVVRTREDGKLSINYDDFGIIAIKAIQEQQKEIETLKAEVEALKQLLTD